MPRNHLRIFLSRVAPVAVLSLLCSTAVTGGAASAKEDTWGIDATVSPSPAGSSRTVNPRLAIELGACRILAPRIAGLEKPLAELARLLKEHGADVAISSPSQCLDASTIAWRTDEKGAPKGATTILIGNINNNRALLPLYGAFLDFSDAYYPGGNGHVIRTIKSGPFRGADSIVLGASSEAGAVNAVTRFCEILKELGPREKLPGLLEVQLDEPQLEKLGATRARPNATYDGYLYALTGEKKYAEACRDRFLKPDKLDGQSFYIEFDNDYFIEPLLRSWALVCDSGAFSSDEVEQVHRFFMNSLVRIENHTSIKRDGKLIGGRHQTMGMSGFFSVVRHLLRRGNFTGLDAERLSRYETWGKAYFANALTTYRDDMDDFQSFHTIQSLANHALETGRGDYFKSPEGFSPLELAARRAYANTDNLGYYCGSGTYEETRIGALRKHVMLGYPLAMLSGINNDPGARWLLRNFRGAGVAPWGIFSVGGTHAFAVEEKLSDREPRELLGILKIPVDRYHYERMPRAADPGNRSVLYQPLPYERIFDKLCFRDRFDPRGQYLALQGNQLMVQASAQGAAPIDANSILRYTDKGVIWLVSNSAKRGNFYRNAVYVDDGGDDSPGLGGCELVGQAEAGGAHLVVSRLGEYNGTDWTRHILWLRGRAFGVIDSVRGKAEGDRRVVCSFKSAHPARLENRQWSAWSGEAEFHLLNADTMPLSSTSDGREGASVPTYLREFQINRGIGKPPTVFRNLFYTSDARKAEEFHVKPLGENAMLIFNSRDSNARPAVFAVRGNEPEWSFGPFKTDAESIYLGEEGICAVGGTRLEFNGRDIKTGARISPEVLRAIQDLWEKASPVHAAAASSGEEPVPIWSFAEMRQRKPAVAGPVVKSSEPPLTGSLDQLVDRELSYSNGEVSWENRDGLTLTFDLRRPLGLSTIEYATGLLAQRNHIPGSAAYPDRVATVEFSNDAFQEDIRGGLTTFQGGFTLESLHKGSTFAMGRWRLSGLDPEERARYVRIRFPGGKPLSLNEVYIREDAGTEAVWGPTLVADLLGKGSSEIALTNDTGELVLLTPEGKKLWSRLFPGAVTCLNAASLEKGAEPTLVVGTREARLYGFSPTGEQKWMVDFATLIPAWEKETVRKLHDVPTPYSISFTSADQNGRRDIIVGHYCHVSRISSTGEVLQHTFAYGSFHTISLVNGMDFTHDGHEDALLCSDFGRMPIFDLVTHKADRMLQYPPGAMLALQGWSNARPEDPSVFFASENGLGVVHPRTGKFQWQKKWTPLSCAVAVAPDDPDNPHDPSRILVGKRDGWLFILDKEGEVETKRMIDGEIRLLAVSSSHPLRFWVATQSDVRLLDDKLATLKELRCTAQKIQALNDGRLLILKADGTAVTIATGSPEGDATGLRP